MEIIYIDMISSLYSGSCVCVCVSGLGVLFSVGVCMRNLLIFLQASKRATCAQSCSTSRALYTYTYAYIYIDSICV